MMVNTKAAMLTSTSSGKPITNHQQQHSNAAFRPRDLKVQRLRVPCKIDKRIDPSDLPDDQRSETLPKGKPGQAGLRSGRTSPTGGPQGREPDVRLDSSLMVLLPA
jgi:hypothetical protein